MKLETFSYLPPLDGDAVARQVAYILDNDWIPGIEFSERLDPSDSYWAFWKLPMFEADNTETVMGEFNTCRDTHPDCYIRITGYDNRRQGQVLSFVAYRPAEEQGATS